MFDARQRILLIDDDPSVRESMLRALDPIRFRVAVAGGVVAAARLCRASVFDLVVCSRVDTLATFRASTRDCEEVPVLVLTRDAHTRPWTMTKRVRFAARPAYVAELRELVVSAVAQ